MTETMTPPADLIPVNDVTDTDKLAALIESMTVHGWAGAPILVHDGGQALTGSHRLAAARQVDIEVPTMDIGDLLAAHGANWSDLLDEYGDWYEAARWLDEVLPVEVIDHYGIDIH